MDKFFIHLIAVFTFEMKNISFFSFLYIYISFKIKGLPGRFDTKKQVANFIVETLWIQVQHAVISYTPGILGTQAPLYPTKLYDDPRAKEKKEFVYMLPGAFAACVSNLFKFVSSPAKSLFTSLSLTSLLFEKL